MEMNLTQLCHLDPMNDDTKILARGIVYKPLLRENISASSSFYQMKGHVTELDQLRMEMYGTANPFKLGKWLNLPAPYHCLLYDKIPKIHRDNGWTYLACKKCRRSAKEADFDESLSRGVKERWQSHYLSNKVLVDLLPQLLMTRVISLSGYKISEVPESIGSLKHLRDLNCTSLPPLGKLQSLKELSIQDMDDVKVVGSVFFGTGLAFPSLESLSFQNMSRWEVWSISNSRSRVGDSVFPCLKKLNIEGCPNLFEFSFERDEVFPCLQELCIRDCPNLAEVSLKAPLLSLRDLTVSKCGDGLLSSLVHAGPSITKLNIYYISGLTNEVWKGVILDLKVVEELEIICCNEIRCLWESKEAEASSKILVNLRKLQLWECENLVSLGEKDEEEYNYGSNLLTSFRSLKIWMLQLGFGLPTCEDSELCARLKKPISEWGPQKFPRSLVDLTLLGETEATTNWSQLSHLHLPSSLTRLCIESFDNLETVSEGLQHLTSLQHLTIHRCPKIKDLPETLLPSLLSLEIWGCPNLKELPVTLLHLLLSLEISKCPDLKERCSRGGPYWPQISRIPCISIDYESQT
nr:NBS-LRR resistance-like protein [Tanacetum cinerariifolium]